MTVQFSLPTFEKLKEDELNTLRPTAQDLFHMLAEFAKYKNVKKEMKLTLIDDQLQQLDTDTCGKFQLYFYKNLLNPEKNSKIPQHEGLTKKTVDILLNEIFTLNQNENE